MKLRLTFYLLVIFFSTLNLVSCDYINSYYTSEKVRKLMISGQEKEAINYINQEIERLPSNGELYRIRGNLYQTLNRPDIAIKNLNKAISIDPNPFHYLSRSYANSFLGYFEKAESDLKKYEDELGKDDFYYLAYLNFAREKLGHDYMLIESKSILPQYPENADLLNLIGFSYLKSGDYSEAIKFLKKANELDESYLTLNNLGNCFYNLGEIEKAKSLIEESISLHSANALAFRNLALILIEEGDNTKACRALQRSAELNYSVVFGDDVQNLISSHCE